MVDKTWTTLTLCIQFLQSLIRLKKNHRNCTETEPFFMPLAIFKNDAHNLEPYETLSNPASHQASNCFLSFLNVGKHGEITTKFQFTGTESEPEDNRKLCQIDSLQYYIVPGLRNRNSHWSGTVHGKCPGIALSSYQCCPSKAQMGGISPICPRNILNMLTNGIMILSII